MLLFYNGHTSEFKRDPTDFANARQKEASDTYRLWEKRNAMSDRTWRLSQRAQLKEDNFRAAGGPLSGWSEADF
ncbi:MAG: hypothetical protein RJS97_02315 [Parvibaculaceae bacterium]